MEKGVAIGVDVGGTNIKAGIVDAQGNLQTQQVIATGKGRGAELVLEQIEGLVNHLSASSAKRIRGVGLALPGAVDDQGGYCLYCPNLGWGKLEIRKRFEKNTRLPVKIINDANAACLGEYFYGRGKGYRKSESTGGACRTFLSLTLGTGIGSGLILNNHLFTGRFGTGVEAGHMVLIPDGYLCSCGGKGCWETLVSAPAITRRAEQKMGHHFKPEMVFQLAREGNTAAREVVKETVFYLAVGLVNLLNLFNPEEISIGGGVAEEEELFSPELYAHIEKNVFSTLKGKVKIAKASQGYFGGVIGASTLWLQKVNVI